MNHVATPSQERAAIPDERIARISGFRRMMMRPEMGAAVAAIAVWIFFALYAGDNGFHSSAGFASYLNVSAELGILAVFVCLLMIGGEFDLSIGSIIGASGMIVALLCGQYDFNIWPAIAIALLASLAIGAVNGIVVVWTGLPSFIVTLATLFMIRGATIGMTRRIVGRTQVGGLGDTPGMDQARAIFYHRFVLFDAKFPVVIAWWIGLAILASLLLMRTPFGNWIFGVGGSEQAARNVGVPSRQVKVILFMGTAASAWLVSVIQVVTFSGSDVLRGQYREFYAIVAVVIGGTLLTGGYGSVIGAVLGAFIYGMVSQGIVFAGIDADWFQLVLGGMLLIAVLINRFIRARAIGVRG